MGGARPSLHHGTNQSGMRDHNERVVLSLLRQHGSLAKTAIARMTGLSAQTSSIIMRMLEADELLSREEPLRGRIGQPLIPMSLNPEGAFFLGLKIGRRSADLVLIDFVGQIRSMLHMPYDYPAPEPIFRFVAEGTAEMMAALTRKTAREDRRDRHCRTIRTVEVGRYGRRTAGDHGPMADCDIRASASRRSARFRSICRTT